MELIRVKFSKPTSPYRKGEIAGFLPDTAKKYVAAKVGYFCDFDGNKVEDPEIIVANISGVPENVPEPDQEDNDQDED